MLRGVFIYIYYVSLCESVKFILFVLLRVRSPVGL